jgi:hypothetical protein
LSVTADQWLQYSGPDQIALVDNNGSWKVILFGGSKQSVDEIGLYGGFCGAGHYKQLIDVCSDYMASIATCSSQFGFSSFDANDPALIGTLGFDTNAIAGYDDVSLVGG